MLKFLDAPSDSIKNKLNKVEVWRSSILAMLSSAISLVITIITMLIADPNFLINLDSFIKNVKSHDYIPLVIGILTFVADALRRKYTHGS